MWPLFNRASCLVIMCISALLTHHIKIGLASALKRPSKIE